MQIDQILNEMYDDIPALTEGNAGASEELRSAIGAMLLLTNFYYRALGALAGDVDSEEYMRKWRGIASERMSSDDVRALSEPSELADMTDEAELEAEAGAEVESIYFTTAD
jgi:hypothetical protein